VARNVPDASKRDRKGAVSDRVGGPSNARGLNYQVDWAILKTLELIATAKNAPQKSCVITIEPRIVAESTTAWDVHSSVDDVVTEAKLKPTRSDVRDFLARARESGHNGRIHLVYGKKSGTLLSDLEVLTRLARESEGDPPRFDRLVELQHVTNAEEVFAVLGPEHHSLLQRMDVEDLPEESLRREVEFYARQLAGSGGDQLVAFLFERVHRAGEARLRIDTSLLILELETSGLHLFAPPEVSLIGEAQELMQTLLILQCCPEPLPVEVLAQSAYLNVPDLIEALRRLENDGVIRYEGEYVRIGSRGTQIDSSGFQDVIARTIDHLVTFVRGKGTTRTNRSQLRNAIALCKVASLHRPGAVIGVFKRVQGAMKALGDKHLVLEVAELCIEAANRMGSDEGAAQARALTLVCGKSWVYQRIGRLEEALVLARKSFDIGEAIRWPRNTAYCTKCIGRIHRLRAEESTDPVVAGELLNQSVDCLQRAIRLFEQSPDYGPADPDTGDCYSLLGRTYLTLGQLESATAQARKAFGIIPAGNSKDYLDLEILAGDLEARTKRWDAADLHYSAVLEQSIPDDYERSEILARAHLRRGIARAADGRTAAARADYESAFRIWTDLDDRVFAAKAEWKLIRLTSPVPRDHVAMFESEKCERTRVKAFHMHEGRVKTAKGVAAHRSNPPRAQIDHLLRQARKEVMMEPEW
jgi:hypothetical protein